MGRAVFQAEPWRQMDLHRLLEAQCLRCFRLAQVAIHLARQVEIGIGVRHLVLRRTDHAQGHSPRLLTLEATEPIAFRRQNFGDYEIPSLHLKEGLEPAGRMGFVLAGVRLAALVDVGEIFDRAVRAEIQGGSI